MKKFISLVLSIVMILMMSLPAFASTSAAASQEEMISCLIDRGYPAIYLEFTSPTAIESLYLDSEATFGGAIITTYDEETGTFTDYDIPPEALEDETFAAMISEAEKYLGYPYVWGGSSPSTSFDCSGFVSWVINHSGWSVGRQTAQGLYDLCTPVSGAQAKPGDLIFFVGTYDTAGVSHVGIYVGGGMMIHCGDPISYADINTSYWQSHYFSFGRLP